jgi:hypothetical protein
MEDQDANPYLEQDGDEGNNALMLGITIQQFVEFIVEQQQRRHDAQMAKSVELPFYKNTKTRKNSIRGTRTNALSVLNPFSFWSQTKTTTIYISKILYFFDAITFYALIVLQKSKGTRAPFAN